MKRFISKKTVAIGLTAGLVLGVSGAALAYWTSTGSGAGSANTGSQGAVTLTQTSVVTNLRPAGLAQDLKGTVTNANSGTNAYIGTVTPSIDAATAFNGTCSAADYTLTPAVVNADVADGATNVAFGTIQFNNTGSNQNDCQGQALVLKFTSN